MHSTEKAAPRLQRTGLPGEPVGELEVDEALKVAVGLHQRGYLDAAHMLYERILAIVPDHVDALQFDGVLLCQTGDDEGALVRIRQAIDLKPEAAGPWNNLGNVLLSLQRFDEAGDAYERCAALAPDDADPYNNLALLRKAQGRPAEAEAAFRRAIELRPEFVDAYNNFGNLLRESGRVREAVEQYCRAATCAPRHPETRRLLALAHLILGETEKAERIYRSWLEEDPDNPLARHYLAACTGEEVPSRASDAYVVTTFDRFAESFDANLGRLLYRAPELVADEVAHLCGTAGKDLDVLDAGCGTGLCGPLVSGHARRLVGVDLSGEMLQRARGRAVYDTLHKAELTAFLASAGAEYDLVISADTLCYFGALEEVAGAACHALRPGGCLVFTVEATGPDAPPPAGHRIQPNGRYAHAPAYVEATFKAAGFTQLVMKDTHLRMEAGLPVPGLLVSCRKPRSAEGERVNGSIAGSTLRPTQGELDRS